MAGSSSRSRDVRLHNRHPHQDWKASSKTSSNMSDHLVCRLAPNQWTAWIFCGKCSLVMQVTINMPKVYISSSFRQHLGRVASWRSWGWQLIEFGAQIAAGFKAVYTALTEVGTKLSEDHYSLSMMHAYTDGSVDKGIAFVKRCKWFLLVFSIYSSVCLVRNLKSSSTKDLLKQYAKARSFNCQRLVRQRISWKLTGPNSGDPGRPFKCKYVTLLGICWNRLTVLRRRSVE